MGTRVKVREDLTFGTRARDHNPEASSCQLRKLFLSSGKKQERKNLLNFCIDKLSSSAGGRLPLN